MRFGLIHRVMTGTLATLGVLALVTSGKLHPLATAIVLLGLVVGLALPERFRQHASVQLGGVVGPLVVLAVQVARLSVGGDPIPIVVEFAAALQVIRLLTRRGAAHDHQVILLALLHLIAGTVLGGGLTYAVALFGFLIFTPGALVLSHLRREVEGNYRQGARDRTGMPVDVPRILRSRRVIGRGFLLFTCSLAVPVFLLAAFLFMLFPRVGFAWLSIPPVAPARVVGFSSRVDLGGVGTIRTDPTLVMRVVPSDMKQEGGETFARRNFYLRGAVFDTYDGRSWAKYGSSSSRPEENGNEIYIRRAPRPSDRTLLIDLDRIEPPVVFVPGEAVALDVLSGNRRPSQMSSLVTTDAKGQLHYSSLEDRGLSYRVYLPAKGLIFPEREIPGNLRRHLFLPPEFSPKIVRLAEDVTRGKSTPLDIARALEKSLRENYTYDLSSPSGAAKDPLEDFLFRSKRGHCEFYSTAMAMMLRVRGVPSRNVTGFVGGTYNRFGEFYAVRQGDAHSWVEAYLPDRGWIRFDPTPPSSAEPHATATGMISLLRDMGEAAAQSWRQNVEGFDLDKQVGALRRIEQLFRSAETRVQGPGGARLNWRLVGLLGSGLFLLGLVGWLVLRRQKPAPPSNVDLSVAVLQTIELYRRLERVLLIHGVQRPLSTPPLTHAEVLCAAGHPLGPEVLALTRLYVRGRFAGELLSAQEVEGFQQRLERLRRLKIAPEAAAA